MIKRILTFLILNTVIILVLVQLEMLLIPDGEPRYKYIGSMLLFGMPIIVTILFGVAYWGRSLDYGLWHIPISQSILILGVSAYWITAKTPNAIQKLVGDTSVIYSITTIKIIAYASIYVLCSIALAIIYNLSNKGVKIPKEYISINNRDAEHRQRMVESHNYRVGKMRERQRQLNELDDNLEKD